LDRRGTMMMAQRSQRAPQVQENDARTSDVWRAETHDVTMLPLERRRSLEDHLLHCLHQPLRGMDLVSGLAGDVELTSAQRAALEGWKENRGESFYSDVLFTLTHEHFAPEEARSLWNEVTSHKRSLEQQLGRNVGIAVAALDYLSNVASVLPSPTLIPSSTLNDVAEIALVDETTGLFGPSAFRMLLHKEIARASRFKEQLSVVMLDLDDFKTINDRYGHPVGDQVLGSVGRILRSTLRAADIAARCGGEEFAIVLPRTSVDQLFPLLERLRLAIAEARAGIPLITASIGAASFPEHGLSARDLIVRADDALYAAKRDGKNRVAIADR
jgi:diguanylate cyclase (GGDEF)-like protein